MSLRFFLGLCILCLSLAFGANAHAQTVQASTLTVALKSGETTEVTDLWYAINCKSQLKSAPEVTILDGPPGVTASVIEAQVVPRMQQCSKPVLGGKLRLTAGTIEDQSSTVMTLRVRFKTKDGDRDRSIPIILSLFP
jgi:hypothetical protein